MCGAAILEMASLSYFSYFKHNSRVFIVLGSLRKAQLVRLLSGGVDIVSGNNFSDMQNPK